MKYQKLIRNSDKILFVSPHFDDVIFSAGGYLSEVVKPKNAIVANVFTAIQNTPDSLSARRYLAHCNATDKNILYKERDTEDSVVFDHLSIRKINLGFVEALWRTKNVGKLVKVLGKYIPELLLMYPTYALHIVKGAIHKDDEKTINRLVRRLDKIIQRNNITVVFGPMGVGQHIDHIIVREAVKRLKDVSIVLWEDFPYSTYSHSTYSDKEVFVHKPNWSKKVSLMKMYESQYAGVFPQKPKQKNEVFIRLK